DPTRWSTFGAQLALPALALANAIVVRTPKQGADANGKRASEEEEKEGDAYRKSATNLMRTIALWLSGLCAFIAFLQALTALALRQSAANDLGRPASWLLLCIALGQALDVAGWGVVSTRTAWSLRRATHEQEAYAQLGCAALLGLAQAYQWCM